MTILGPMDTHQIMRQTATEVLAMAVCEVFPEAQTLNAYVTGIDFTYDFTLPQPIDTPHIPMIEEKMREIGKRNTPIEIIEMVPKNAAELFRHHNQIHKAIDLENHPDTTITLLRIGNFYDLYSAPLAPTTSEIGTIHIDSIEKLPDQVIRIHGTTLPDKKSLKEFLKKREKAKKWDHILLGKSLNLFSFSQDQTISWHPKGTQLRQLLLSWWQNKNQKKGYQLLYTPPLVAPDHRNAWKKGQGNRFFGTYFQFENNSSYPFFRGLLTAPTETCDLASFFGTEHEVFEEFTSLLQFINETIKLFGFEHHWCKQQTDRLISGDFSLIEKELQEEIPLRVEVFIADAYGQYWPGPWVEIDREEDHIVMKYSLFGSIERFIALLIEATHGSIPLLLAPEHVRIIVVNERNIPYAKSVANEIEKIGCRSQLDTGNQSVGQRVNAAIEEKTPTVVVIGDKEEKTETVTIRLSDKGEETKKRTEFIEEIKGEI